MKLSHARGATQDGWVMVERFDRMWSTGEDEFERFYEDLQDLLELTPKKDVL